ncbi:MAG: NepR family anti-sigma factor [Alsobacter sp.]
MPQQGDDPRAVRDRVGSGAPGAAQAAAPDFSEREQEELLSRLGRGVRAMLGDVLLDPLPADFRRLLEQLDKAERGGAGRRGQDR